MNYFLFFTFEKRSIIVEIYYLLNNFEKLWISIKN
jgi:hypothetical protein